MEKDKPYEPMGEITLFESEMGRTVLVLYALTEDPEQEKHPED